mmetsp:Transcript_5488/g.9052  ORF Transcript_5488/g.9052 Transcript_5488/m.9052 type:complete len:324 (-) Transcript_5488:1329-2300(-)
MMIPLLTFLFTCSILLSLVCHGLEEQQQWIVISNGIVSSAHDAEADAQLAAAVQKEASPNEYVAYTEWKVQVQTVGDTVVPPPYCFPGDATVQLEGKQGPTLMKHLKLGDKVLAVSGDYESVYSFGHLDRNTIISYLELTTAAATLLLTSDHMVLLKGGSYVPSSIVQVGDELLMQTGASVSVRAIQAVQKKGAFAPFTASGTIIVNGIQASSFIAFQNSGTLRLGGFDTGLTFQFLAFTFESPHRLWCSWAGCYEETYTAEGISTWVDTPHRLARWFLRQQDDLCVPSFFVAIMAAVYLVSYTILPTLMLVTGGTRQKLNLA